ncbi:hypothetical protein Fmac_017403 [Flemingia macrophylla]|uniref:Uncharacterized protein n=1 Tax=Flemingia macrophylla TaxID=520843 RepID=A0ABD1M2G0_9FABA
MCITLMHKICKPRLAQNSNQAFIKSIIHLKTMFKQKKTQNKLHTKLKKNRNRKTFKI